MKIKKKYLNAAWYTLVYKVNYVDMGYLQLHHSHIYVTYRLWVIPFLLLRGLLMVPVVVYQTIKEGVDPTNPITTMCSTDPKTLKAVKKSFWEEVAIKTRLSKYC